MKIFIYLIIYILFSQTSISAQWIFQNSGTNDILYDVYFFNESLGWIIAQHGNILRTTNGGLDWSSYNVIPNTQITSIVFITESIGYVTAGYSIYKTTDGGSTWSIFKTFSISLHKVQFLDNDLIFLMGSGRFIYKSTDGGNNWNNFLVDDSTYHESWNISDIYFQNENIGFLSTTEGFYQYGSVYKTINGGENWTRVWENNYYVAKLFGVQQSDVLFAIESFYATPTFNWKILYRSTDGGMTWSQLNTAANIWDISIITQNIIWAVGRGSIFSYQNKILRSSDLGSNWSIEFDSTFINLLYLREIFFISDTLGWVVGSPGKILKRGIPTDYSTGYNPNYYFELCNNYPNPFNPTTKIKYQIPRNGIVSLKVYDLLGSEVATLVNEEKPAGEYEIEFNPSNLSSGVYFYKLQAEDYNSVKKMILLK